MVVGNLVALAQRSLKRMLAYSSVAHAGYLLAAVWPGTRIGAASVMVYLFAYGLTSLAAFGLLGALGRGGERDLTADDLAGLARSRPWVAAAFGVCMLSLLGFPGTFGFIGKWMILSALVTSGQWIIPVVLVLTSVVSAGYYLPVIMAMYMKPAPEGAAAPAPLTRAGRDRGRRHRGRDPRAGRLARRRARRLDGHGRRPLHPRLQPARPVTPPGGRPRARPQVDLSPIRHPRPRRRGAHAGAGPALGSAFTALGARRLGRPPVLAVGRDNRPSGGALAAALRAGIVAAGGTAVDVGELPTPALYFAVHALETDGGVQVTGSHNPPEFNGFKMVLAGESVHGDEIQALYETITLEQWTRGAGRESADGSVLPALS